MTIDEVKSHVNSRPREYLESKHGIVIRNNENARCPVCSGSKKSTKFSIRSDNKLKCFSCGFYGDVLDLIAHDNGLDIKRNFIDIIKKACEEFGLALDDKKGACKEKTGEQPAVPTVSNKMDLVQRDTYPVPQHYDFTDIILQAHEEVAKTDYFTKRGFGDELIRKYKLGFSLTGYNALFSRYPELKNGLHQARHYQYVIPVLNYDGTCNYFMVRATDGLASDSKNGKMCKILNMKNPNKRNPVRLFNDRYIISHDKYEIDTLFIVEGWADALSLEEIGYHAIALNSTSNASKFVKLCLTYSPCMRFLVCLDNDEAGNKAKSFLLGELTRNGYTVGIAEITGSCKDANDFLLQDKKAFAEMVEESIDINNPESEKMYTPISEIGNAYYMISAKVENVRCLSNFTMKPQTLIEGVDGGVYTIEFTKNNGKVAKKQFKSSILSSVRTFKNAINKESAEYSFMGTDAVLEYVKMHMFQKYPNYERKTGLDYVGIQKHKGAWLYIDADKAINSSGVQDGSIMAYVPIGQTFQSGLLEAESVKKEELLQLSTRLFGFNTVTRTIPIVSWCAACFLKERLNRRKMKLSHLFIHGTAGSGKTDSSTAVIMPLFGLDEEPPLSCSNVKEFALLAVCSANNLFPVILDEYKPSKLGSYRVDLISRTLRSAYDGHKTDRGHSDQTVTSYHYRAPIVMIGESSIEEKAIKERSIEVLYGKTDRTEKHTDNYFYLKKNRKTLNSLGRELLFQALRLSDEELDTWIEESERFQELNYESRNITGLTVLYIGMKLIQAVYQNHGLDLCTLIEMDTDTISRILIENLKESLDENGYSKSAVDQILETFDTMASKGLLIEDVDYVVSRKNNELQLLIKRIYPAFAKYIKDYNLSHEIEYLVKKSFAEQLRKTDYYIRYEKRTFKNENDKDVQKLKCFILDLSKVSRRLDMEIFRSDNEDTDFSENVVANNYGFKPAEQIAFPT